MDSSGNSAYKCLSAVRFESETTASTLSNDELFVSKLTCQHLDGLIVVGICECESSNGIKGRALQWRAEVVNFSILEIDQLLLTVSPGMSSYHGSQLSSEWLNCQLRELYLGFTGRVPAGQRSRGGAVVEVFFAQAFPSFHLCLPYRHRFHWQLLPPLPLQNQVP